ncbi:MAG: hypothetical protein ACJ8HQ_10450, partial [Chthoniobacterales bacterium]
KEQRALGLLFAGETASAAHWRAGAKRQLDFFDLKGALDVVRIPKLSFRRTENSALALAADILSGDEVVGLAGQLSASRAAQLSAAAPVFVAQIVLDGLGLTSDSQRFSEIEKYPAITRDISMVVPDSLTHEQIVDAIWGEPLLQRAQFFDVLVGDEAARRFGAGRKSLAYTLTYRDRNRTLTNDEVAVVHTRIRERLKRELGAELRE